MRRAFAIALFACCVAGAVAQPKDEAVIYPRGSAVPEGASVHADKPAVNSSLVVAIVLLAGAGAWWLWLKRRGLTRSAAVGGARLSIAESRSLGSRQYLVVADYEGKKFLLGVCPGSIELLTPLNPPEGKE